MAFIISFTPTRAFRRLREGETGCESLDELMDVQDRLECDLYIALPDEYNQRRVFLYDP